MSSSFYHKIHIQFNTSQPLNSSLILHFHFSIYYYFHPFSRFFQTSSFLIYMKKKKKIPPHSPHLYKLLYIENKIKYKIQNSQLLILVPIVSYHRRPVAIWRRKAYLSFHTLIPRLLLFSLVFVYIKDIIENIYKYIYNNNNTQHIILKITTE